MPGLNPFEQYRMAAESERSRANAGARPPPIPEDSAPPLEASFIPVPHHLPHDGGWARNLHPEAVEIAATVDAALEAIGSVTSRGATAPAAAPPPAISSSKRPSTALTSIMEPESVDHVTAVPVATVCFSAADDGYVNLNIQIVGWEATQAPAPSTAPAPVMTAHLAASPCAPPPNSAPSYPDGGASIASAAAEEGKSTLASSAVAHNSATIGAPASITESAAAASVAPGTNVVGMAAEVAACVARTPVDAPAAFATPTHGTLDTLSCQLEFVTDASGSVSLAIRLSANV